MKKTIQSALVEAVDMLQRAGINEARMEATSLLMHVLGVDRAFLIAHPENELSEEQSDSFRELSRRRAVREPLQYIIGYQEFFKLNFEVTPDVLIPRPETEIIVESALALVNREQRPFILDVGTGSGCIVISLLNELKNAHAMATDISSNALEVAARNARRHNVNDRVTFLQADALSQLNQSAAFSLIVSNPPYIPAGDIATLQREVREHEPLTALVSGVGGLDHIRALLRETPPLLEAGGHFIFEIGFGQREAVERLVDRATWDLIDVKSDLQKIPRTAVLQKR